MPATLHAYHAFVGADLVDSALVSVRVIDAWWSMLPAEEDHVTFGH